MKRIIETYQSNKFNISFYIKEFCNKAITSESKDLNYLKSIFTFDKSVEVIYYVNCDFKQITPSIWRNQIEDKKLGTDKSYYFNMLNLEKLDVHISNPYVHYQTGELTLTVVKKQEDGYLVLDFNILRLLESLRLLEYNSAFSKTNSIIMGMSGLVLASVSLFLIFYGTYTFILMLLFTNGTDVFHEIFFSIISITIGISVFDLSKTFIENEVFFKKIGYANKHKNQTKILTKFLHSIIIALSIESLMAVFKIMLNNNQNTLNALYLIIGVVCLIVGTGLYNFLMNYHNNDKI